MTFENIIAIFRPFATPRGTVFLMLAYDDGQGGQIIEELALDSEEALALVKRALTEMLGRLPRPAETKEALDVLRGAALEAPRQETTVPQPEEVKLTALGKVVVHIAENNPTTKDNGALLSMVTQVARKLDLLDTTFPKNEDSLGKQLAGLVPVVAKLGVKLERHENARPREWTIHPKQKTPVQVEEKADEPEQGSEERGARTMKQFRERVQRGERDPKVTITTHYPDDPSGTGVTSEPDDTSSEDGGEEATERGGD